MRENKIGQARLDPRRPLVLAIRELGRRPGSMLPHHDRIDAPTELAVQSIGVRAGSPLDLDLRLESVVEGVFVSGDISAVAGGECVRCLAPVSVEVDARVDELFAYPDSLAEQTTEEDEVRRIEGEYLDLEPVVRDAVVLALPLAPLCKDDCQGLCPTCGERLDDLPTGHSHETVDPRWAALAERFGTTEHDPAHAGTSQDPAAAGDS
jgi:uncharacterized protein